MSDPLAIIGILLTVSIVVLGFARYKMLSWEMKILHLYFITDLAFSLVQAIWAHYKLHNLWTFHFQIPIEYALLMLVFSHWVNSKPMERATLISIPVFIALWVTIYTIYEDLDKFSSYNKPIESLLLIIMGTYILFLAGRDDSQLVFRQPRFWISSGIILYFAGAFLTLAFSDYILSLSEKMLDFVWNIHNSIGVVAYTLYLVGFICQIRYQKSGGF